MIFRIIEDVVERRLELIGRRTFAMALTQAVLTLVIVGFLCVFFAGIGSSFISKMPPDWLGRFDCWWRLVAAFLVMGVPALLIAGLILRVVMMFSDGWHRLTWDGRAGELVALRRGGLLGGNQQTTIPLAEVRRIDLHASPGGRNLALALTIHSGKQLQRAPLEATVHVRHVDRREEAMDLLFRIGRMCGLGYYAVEGSDLRKLKVRLLREPKNSERFQPIPESSSAVRYEDDVVSPNVQAPAMRVGKFQRKAFAGSVSGTRLVQWQPGERIHFHEPPPGPGTYGIAAAVAAAIAGFFAYHAAPLAAARLPWWATMLAAIVVGALGACLWIWLAYREREVIFDWPAGRVSWRIGSRLRHAPLSAIETFLLRGIKEYKKTKGRPGYTNYWCRLEMSVEGRTIYILQSNRFRDLEDAPADRLGPLTAALGESLNVPWQWREYD